MMSTLWSRSRVEAAVSRPRRSRTVSASALAPLRILVAATDDGERCISPDSSFGSLFLTKLEPVQFPVTSDCLKSLRKARRASAMALARTGSITVTIS